jgi:hypothetical protein
MSTFYCSAHCSAEQYLAGLFGFIGGFILNNILLSVFYFNSEESSGDDSDDDEPCSSDSPSDRSSESDLRVAPHERKSRLYESDLTEENEHSFAKGKRLDDNRIGVELIMTIDELKLVCDTLKKKRDEQKIEPTQNHQDHPTDSQRELQQMFHEETNSDCQSVSEDRREGETLPSESPVVPHDHDQKSRETKTRCLRTMCEEIGRLSGKFSSNPPGVNEVTPSDVQKNIPDSVGGYKTLKTILNYDDSSSTTIPNRLSRDDERHIIASFSSGTPHSLISHSLKSAREIAAKMGYNVHPVWKGVREKRPLAQYNPKTIGVRITKGDYEGFTTEIREDDAEIVTEIIDVGGVDIDNRGMINLS